MLFALSGSQGCGKTTITNDLKTMGYNVISRKSSRSVLSDWNLTLSEVYNDHGLMQKFQTEVLHRKHADELSMVDNDEIWFTDRSYMDLLTYSTIILGHNNNNAEWLSDYAKQCYEYQHSYKLTYHIGLLPTVEDDGVRASSKEFAQLFDTGVGNFLKGYDNLYISTPLHTTRLADIISKTSEFI